MDFTQAILKFENGDKLYRTGWGYSSHAFIELIEHNHVRQFYITGAYNTHPLCQEGYGMTFSDIRSTDWQKKII